MATVIHADGRTERLDLPSDQAAAMLLIERTVGGAADRLIGFDHVFVRRRYAELPSNAAATGRFHRPVGGTVVVVDAHERESVPPKPLSKRQQVTREIRQRRRR